MILKKYLQFALITALCCQLSFTSVALEARDSHKAKTLLQRLNKTFRKPYAATKKFITKHKKLLIGAGLIATPGLLWIAIKTYKSVPRLADITQFNQQYDAASVHQGFRYAECSVCLNDQILPILSCGHSVACAQCVDNSINPGIQTKRGFLIRCPQVGCRHQLIRSDINTITEDPQRRQTCYVLARKNWVLRQGKQARVCPTAHCDESFLYDGRVAPKTCDSCHQVYCTNCLVNHAPGMACNNNHDDAAAANWKSKNSKPCPVCATAIEKNYGCDHMTCTQCAHEFCWICLGPYPRCSCRSAHATVTPSWFRRVLNRYF